MKIIHQFEDLKSMTQNRKVGWFMLGTKHLKESCHQGYLDCLAKLKQENDIVIVDLVHFGALCQAVWNNNIFTPKLEIALGFYQNLLKDHADVLLYQHPEDQILRRFGIDKNRKHIEYYKKLVKDRCDQYPYHHRWGNDKIIQTYCWLHHIYPSFLNIRQAGNTGSCGHRSFFYRDYLQNYLGIDLLITPPARMTTGLLPKGEDTYFDPDLENLLIRINYFLQKQQFSKVRKMKFVDEVFIFCNQQFDTGYLVEVLVNKQGKKGKLIEYFNN